MTFWGANICCAVAHAAPVCACALFISSSGAWQRQRSDGGLDRCCAACSSLQAHFSSTSHYWNLISMDPVHRWREGRRWKVENEWPFFFSVPNSNHIHSCNFSLGGDKRVFTSPNLIITWLLVLLILKLFSHKGLWMKVKLRMKMDWWSQLSHYVRTVFLNWLRHFLVCVS